jgi:hypothetical protein
MSKKALKPLTITFLLSGIWDTIAGTMYLFFIGTDRSIENHVIDPFFAIFLGSFFLCFAFLKFITAHHIRRYAFVIGCLIFGRLFYVIQLYYTMLFIDTFTTTFWFTGLIDGCFVVLYIVFSIRGGLGLGDLFLPKKEL